LTEKPFLENTKSRVKLQSHNSTAEASRDHHVVAGHHRSQSKPEPVSEKKLSYDQLN